MSSNIDSFNNLEPSLLLDEYVFCHVLEDIGMIKVSDDPTEDDIELSQGDIYALRYRNIQYLLEQGKLHLV